MTFRSAPMLAAIVAVAFAHTVALAAEPKPGSEKVEVNKDQMWQLDVVAAEVSAFRTLKQAVGQIAFNEDASTVVLTPFSGRITRLLARVGDDVKRGAPLFEIDSPDVAQAQTDLLASLQAVEKTRAQASLAKRSLDRQTGLFAEKATSQRELDQARNDSAIAESDLVTAQGALSASRNKLRVILGRDDSEVARLERERVINPLITVNAPIDGTVVGRKVGPGQFVRSDAGEALFSISDLSTMWLKAFVPENDIPFVQTGQELEVRVTALPDRVFRARIIAIGAASDAQTRRIVVRSEISNPDRVLRAEMFASFRIATGSPTSAPAVPVEAVIRQGDLASVWVQQVPMVFARRKVELGLEQDGRIQIRSGVKPGEFVIGRGAIFVDNEWRQ